MPGHAGTHPHTHAHAAALSNDGDSLNMAMVVGGGPGGGSASSDLPLAFPSRGTTNRTFAVLGHTYAHAHPQLPPIPASPYRAHAGPHAALHAGAIPCPSPCPMAIMRELAGCRRAWAPSRVPRPATRCCPQCWSATADELLAVAHDVDDLRVLVTVPTRVVEVLARSSTMRSLPPSREGRLHRGSLPAMVGCRLADGRLRSLYWLVPADSELIPQMRWLLSGDQASGEGCAQATRPFPACRCPAVSGTDALGQVHLRRPWKATIFIGRPDGLDVFSLRHAHAMPMPGMPIPYAGAMG